MFMARGGAHNSWIQKGFKYPEHLKIMIQEAYKANNTANIYFSAHLFRTGETKRKENSAPIGAVWIDMDNGELENLQPKPTMCWETSEGKYQAFWVLDKTYDPQEVEEVVRYLTYKTPGADRGCWNLGRVLRFPNSLNFKYKPPFRGEILWMDGPHYTLDDLMPVETEEGDTTVELGKVFEMSPEKDIPRKPKNVPTMQEALIQFGPRIPQRVWELLDRTPKPEDDYSEELWRLERMLLEAGVPIKSVFGIVRESVWNKYKRDGRPEHHLWNEVYKASLEKGPYHDDPEELPFVSIDELLVYSEKPEWLVDGIWMEKNVGWIAGVGKSYKTVLSVDLALSVASGTPFLGKYPVMDPGPVLMIQEEDPVWRVAHRVQVISQKKGLTVCQIRGKQDSLVLQMCDSKVPLYISIGGGVSFSDDNRLAAVEKAIQKYRPKMIILDPLFMMTAGLDDFKASEISTALIKIKEWRNRYNCAVAIVHHYRKGQGSAVEKLYGSQALYAWSENNLFITREDNSNVITIERDIKDAQRLDAKIFVDFLNIDEEYRFLCSEKSDMPQTSPGKETYDQVVGFLRTFSVGSKVDFQEIEKHTGMARKTVGDKIDILVSNGKVETKGGGRGQKKFVVLKEALWEGGHVAGGLVLDDF